MSIPERLLPAPPFKRTIVGLWLFSMVFAAEAPMLTGNDPLQTDDSIRPSLDLIDRSFDRRFFLWLASLWDPETGGFFYMKSSQANPRQYPPTLESTALAINTIGAQVREPLPDWLKARLVEFVNARQDPNTGLFVDIHPDPLSRTDPSLTARAQSFAMGLLNRCGGRPKYPLPGTPRASTSMSTTQVPPSPPAMERSSLASPPTDRMSPSPKPATDLLATKYGFQTKADIVKWLDDRPWSNAWSAGQHIADVGVYLKGLSPERRDLFLETAWTYLAEKQDPRTGTIGEGSGYARLSGVMKMKTIYYPFKKPFPRVPLICQNMIDTMKSEEPSFFMQVRNAIENFGAFIENGTPEEKAALRRHVPEAIRISAGIVGSYRRVDGGFSYGRSNATAVSQRARVGEGLDEGDVVGTDGVSVFRVYAWKAAGLDYEKPPASNSAGFFSAMTNRKGGRE